LEVLIFKRIIAGPFSNLKFLLVVGVGAVTQIVYHYIEKDMKIQGAKMWTDSSGSG
jgi:hypothetical protein